MAVSLILGGVRSGKSAHARRAAETEALARGRVPVLIATATAGDAEMAERIARHQAERGDGWRTIEAPLDLADALADLTADDVAVVDCLTLWLSNSLMEEKGHDGRLGALVPALAACPARLWLVGNEVGSGIVPNNALARRFRDEAGWLHQRIAETAAEVTLVIAGLPLALKGPSGG
jgi:adenosylcobinamide kinase/adenosylcobinamide-phosphate guanylyltransferase